MYLNTVFKYNVFKYCPALSIVIQQILLHQNQSLYQAGMKLSNKLCIERLINIDCSNRPGPAGCIKFEPGQRINKHYIIAFRSTHRTG